MRSAIMLQGQNGEKGYKPSSCLGALDGLVKLAVDDLIETEGFSEIDIAILEGMLIDCIYETIHYVRKDLQLDFYCTDDAIPDKMLSLGNGNISAYRWHAMRRKLENATASLSALQQGGPKPGSVEWENEEKNIEDAVKKLAMVLTGKEIEFKEENDY